MRFSLSMNLLWVKPWKSQNICEAWIRITIKANTKSFNFLSISFISYRWYKYITQASWAHPLSKKSEPLTLSREGKNRKEKKQYLFIWKIRKKKKTGSKFDFLSMKWNSWLISVCVTTYKLLATAIEEELKIYTSDWGNWSRSGRSDLDDEARENIIRVMDMRVALHDKGVAALVTDGVEGLAFTDHINFITGPVDHEVFSPSNRVVVRHRIVLSDGSKQDQGQ